VARWFSCAAPRLEARVDPREVGALCRTAAALARGASAGALVAGSLGPTGLSPPLGPGASPRALAARYERPLEALAAAGVDLLWLESQHDLHEALAADVVITCTASQTALLRGEWLKLGTHVTAVGSDGPNKQELDATVPARADLLVVDSREQSARIGELHHALAAGLIDERKAVELGEICALTHPGRTSADQLTVCDLTGVGVQDVAAANVVMANAGGRGDVVTL